jgi:hypothetical protein|nr:MAG TPA: YopX protein [Caudoviricetes sp.]
MILKFRAWDRETKTMNGMAEIYRNRNQEIELHPRDENIILMQSTGLKDKNGQEIFEGDITASGNHPIKGVVEFRTDLGMWVNCLKGYDYYEYLGNVASGIEIISNIHENPELLEAIR